MTAGFVDWVRFLCGSAQLDPAGSTCGSFGSIDPSDLNSPNIAMGDLVGSANGQPDRDQRRQEGRLVPRPRHGAPRHPGQRLATRLSLKRGQSATYHVTFTRTGACGEPVRPRLARVVRQDAHRPLASCAIRPLDMAAPAEVDGTGTQRIRWTVTVRPGFTGTLTAAPAGLVPRDRRQPDAERRHRRRFPVTAPAASSNR
jgi:hypothetical protein